MNPLHLLFTGLLCLAFVSMPAVAVELNPPDTPPLSESAETPSGNAAEASSDGLADEPGTPAPILITGLYAPQNAISRELFMFPVGDSLSTLTLPITQSCTLDGYNQWDTYECPVEWHIDQADTTIAGRCAIIGTLIPEAGYALADAVDSTVTYDIMLLEEGMTPEPLARMSYPQFLPCIIPENENPQDPIYWKDAVSSLYCNTANFGEYFLCPFTWDFSTVDAATPGLYTISAIPTLPISFSQPADVAPATAQVAVVAPDRVDLSAPYSVDSATVVCRWLYRVDDPKAMTLEYAVNDGAWQPAPINAYGVCPFAYWSATSLTVYPYALEADQDYYFRLRTGDSISNALLLRRDADTIYTEGGIGGDRNGADGDGDVLPDFSQPAPGSSSGSHDNGGGAITESSAPTLDSIPDIKLPTPAATDTQPVREISPAPNAPSIPQPSEMSAAPAPETLSAALSTRPAAAPATETVTDAYTELSGARLAHMLHEDTVLFEKQGIAAELSTAFLASLSLPDDALLRVTIEPLAAGFRLDITANGQTVRELGKTIVRLPFDQTQFAQDTALRCVYEGSADTVPLTIDDALGLACVTISRTGSYSIVAPRDNAADEPLSAAPTAPDVSTAQSVPESTPPCGIGWLFIPFAAIGCAVVRERGRGHE